MLDDIHNSFLNLFCLHSFIAELSFCSILNILEGPFVKYTGQCRVSRQLFGVICFNIFQTAATRKEVNLFCEHCWARTSFQCTKLKSSTLHCRLRLPRFNLYFSSSKSLNSAISAMVLKNRLRFSAVPWLSCHQHFYYHIWSVICSTAKVWYFIL